MTIQIKCPIWHGGHPQVGIAYYKIDKNTEWTLFEIMYKDRKGKRLWDYPFRVNTDLLLHHKKQVVAYNVLLYVVPLSLCEWLDPVKNEWIGNNGAMEILPD